MTSKRQEPAEPVEVAGQEAAPLDPQPEPEPRQLPQAKGVGLQVEASVWDEWDVEAACPDDYRPQANGVLGDSTGKGQLQPVKLRESFDWDGEGGSYKVRVIGRPLAGGQ